MLTRKEIENWEEKNLSSLAMKSKYSKGRKCYEKEHPYRTVYQRDRDRIIHCAAFRRLEYKTQVFVYHEGDYYRTRLTHTLEVSQIARTLSKILRLNEDLVEAIALAHDLGHTPFGHAVESILNNLMKDSGGFNHNIQGLRVVDLLEERYPNVNGLNLSWETREGIINHNNTSKNDYDIHTQEFNNKNQPTLEAQVMDTADEIAYDSHDLDDGIKSNMLEESQLMKNSLWKLMHRDLKSQFCNLKQNLRVYLIIRNLINFLVTDLFRTTKKKIKKAGIDDYREVKKLKAYLLQFSPQVQELRQELRNFLYENLYCHWRVIRMSNKAKRFIKELFNLYLNNPELLPPSFKQKRKEKTTIKRLICDYIAGMTDKYALEEYKKLFEAYEKV